MSAADIFTIVKAIAKVMDYNDVDPTTIKLLYDSRVISLLEWFICVAILIERVDDHSSVKTITKILIKCLRRFSADGDS